MMIKAQEMAGGSLIPLTGVTNIRDLGGIQTMDGRTIRHKRLIRSGTLEKATGEDIRILTEDYQMKTVIDFRNTVERMQRPDPKIDGITVYVNPIMEDAVFGITHEEDGQKDSHPIEGLIRYCKGANNDAEGIIAKMYANFIMNDFGIAQYRKFFRYLSGHSNGAVLWHCTAGKDRVGTGTALLLSALGVDRKTILDDYMKTNLYVKEETDYLIGEARKAGADKETLKAITVLLGVCREYMETVFDTIEQYYGTMQTYLEKAMGLTNDKIVQLQEMYLE